MVYVVVQPPAGWEWERAWVVYESAVEAQEGDHEGSSADSAAAEMYCTIDADRCGAFADDLRSLGFWVAYDIG